MGNTAKSDRVRVLNGDLKIVPGRTEGTWIAVIAQRESLPRGLRHKPSGGREFTRPTHRPHLPLPPHRLGSEGTGRGQGADCETTPIRRG